MFSWFGKVSFVPYSKVADFLGGCEKLVDHARKQGGK